MDTYVILKDLAIIIVFAKLFGILARKCKAPQVVGELIAGIVLGPSVLGLVQQSDFLAQMAEIGVILLMFSAGLGTSLKDLLRTGVKSLLIACAGVFVPLVLGAILYMSFYGFSAVGTGEIYHAVFIGVILTATSVSITVQALKELGKLKTEVGTTILNAAIIDDVIGIIVLTVVIGFKDPTSNPLKVAASTILFFALAIVLGFLCFKLFNRMNSVFPPSPDSGSCALLRTVLHFRKIFRHRRYYRCIRCGRYPVFPRFFRLHRRKNGYQLLYDFRTDFLCKYRTQNNAQRHEREIRTLCHLFRHRRPCRENYRLWPDVKGMRLYLGRQPENRCRYDDPR